VIRKPRTQWKIHWAANEMGFQVVVRNHEDTLVDEVSRGNSLRNAIETLPPDGQHVFTASVLRQMAKQAAEDFAREFRIPEQNILQRQEMLKEVL
jgi:hypothetical protein